MSIEVKDLAKTFHAPGGDVHALDGINFSVATGQFVSIIGKSTLLAQLGALDQPTSGEILVEGQDITKLSGNKQTAYRSKKNRVCVPTVQPHPKPYCTRKCHAWP